MNWTLHDIQSKLSAGKIRGYTIPDKKAKGEQVVKGGENVAGLEDMTSKRSKMGNVRTVVDGIKFQSGKEAKRYVDLRLLEKQGVISNLRMQHPYELNDGGTHSLRYFADFVYVSDGVEIVEDVKPFDKRTQAYRLSATFKKKRKLMRELLGIEIKIF